MCNKKPLLPPPPPRGSIGARIGFISRKSKNYFNQVVSEEGLFAGQHHIIMMLERVGCATVSQIAEEMRTTSATASVSIKRLEKAGFVEKRSSESDARITKIYLTDKALAVTQRIKSKMDEAEESLTQGLTQEEKYLLSDLLDKVVNNIISQKECDEKC